MLLELRACLERELIVFRPILRDSDGKSVIDEKISLESFEETQRSAYLTSRLIYISVALIQSFNKI
jgi:hypothetical protein